MQYVRSISGSVSKTWNSINPATLSGAIDVIVVEQEDGSLACSPFHVRFGKFSLLRPSEKKVEFTVNGVKQDYAMKLGDGGEAFFVFETSDDIPESLQTSPLVSPASSPPLAARDGQPVGEPDFLDLEGQGKKKLERPGPSVLRAGTMPNQGQDIDLLTPLSSSPPTAIRPQSGDWSGYNKLTEQRSHSEQEAIRTHALHTARSMTTLHGATLDGRNDTYPHTERSSSPPPLPTKEAIERAISLSKQLADSNIPSHVTDTGDLMLDMTGYKTSDEEALRAEVIARKILSEEIEGPYDIGALIGADEHGNLWIYSSEEAKEAAAQRAALSGVGITHGTGDLTSDAASDPGYHSDGPTPAGHRRADSDTFPTYQTPPQTPPENTSTSKTAGDPNRNYAKTLRLTSSQLLSLSLQPGPNHMSFTVNRATCTAFMYLWSHSTPIVISDIDGTITKSDALGHVLNMIGRDWTHIGVAKLYTEIVGNGYNIMYLTSRAVGQADTTRGYLAGVVQDGYKLPRGPTIMSPDRTIAALRREVYLRKPEVFKMACLRDIKNLFGPGKTPFYAGFGNRLTDALSYRSVSIPSNRIFTINSYAEVSLDLLSLNKLKLSYVNMREVVDHYFPPVSQLLQQGGEEFTDFQYWRDKPMQLDEFSDSDSNASGSAGRNDDDSGSDGGSEDEGDDDNGEMGDSYISQASLDGSVVSQSGDEYGEGEGDDEGEYDDDNGSMTNSMYESAQLPAEETPAQLAARVEAEMEAYEEDDTFPVEASPTPLAEKRLEDVEASPTPLAESRLEDVEPKLRGEDGETLKQDMKEAKDGGLKDDLSMESKEEHADLLSPETAAKPVLDGTMRPSHERRLSRDEYSEDRDAEIISGMKGMMIREDSRPGSRAPSADGSRAGSRAGSRTGGERRRRAESNVSWGSDIKE